MANETLLIADESMKLNWLKQLTWLLFTLSQTIFLPFLLPFKTHIKGKTKNYEKWWKEKVVIVGSVELMKSWKL